MVRDIARRALCTAVPLLVLCASPAAAQVAGRDIAGGTLEVPLNKSQVVSTDVPIAKAMVGNAAIADVVPLTDRSIYVLGKTMGSTSLTLYDRGGRVLVVMDVAVGPDSMAYKEQVARLVPTAHIDAQLSGDSLILTGMANDAGAIERAVQLAHTYAGDKVVNMISLGSSQQVMLEVRFAEVRRDMGDSVGARNFANGSKFQGATGPGASLTPGANGNPVMGLSSVLSSFGVFGTTFHALGLDFQSYLDALETKGFAKTLAKPTLVALSGEKASFLAGGEFPIPVAQSGNSGTAGGTSSITVEFKPFGVSLGFTPTVLGDKTINLKVEPEVSSIDPAASIQLNGLSIPGLKTRRASTTLELRDGESFAIAGLLQQDFQDTVNQVPLLGSIPILGALFRSTEFKKGETELLIVVTPHLVQPIKPEQVHLPTDSAKDPDVGKSVLLGEPYDPVPLKQGQPAAKAPAKGGDYEY